MNDATSVEQVPEITNPQVMEALVVVRQLNDVRHNLLENRQHAGDLATASRLLHLDGDILRILAYCLTVEEHPTVREMFERITKIAEETAEMIKVIEAQEMMQAAMFESALVTIH